MKRVVSNGKCTDAKLAVYLKVGRIYEVVEEKKIGEKVKFILKGIPQEFEYDEEWFKIFDVDTVFAKVIPVKGKVIDNISIMKSGMLVSTDITLKPLEVHHIGGNVYEVYEQYKNYIVIVI